MYIEKKYVRLITPDGFSIATWISVAEEPKYSIILCHGITVDSREGGLFLSLEEELLKLNFVVVRFDFPLLDCVYMCRDMKELKA